MRTSQQRLTELAEKSDVVFVIADGLSASAVQTQAAALIAASLPGLAGLKIGPVVIARFGRVALGDEIAEILGGKLCVLLVGERPGLSVADSLGVYITYDPRPGRRDSERNCISNIHANGGLRHRTGGGNSLLAGAGGAEPARNRREPEGREPAPAPRGGVASGRNYEKSR